MSPTTHLSDFLLDALDSGAATAAEKAGADAHLGDCPLCRDRLARIGAGFAGSPEVDERALLARLRTAAEEQEKKRLSSRLRRFLAPLALLTATAAIAIVALPSSDAGTAGGLRAKGGAGLHVFRERDGAAVEATSGDLFRPGEPLRFSVDLESPAWVALVGIESSGTLYRVFPRGEAASRLPAGKGQALPGAVSLDQAPGEDMLHLVVCESEAASQACRSSGPGAPPTCPGGCTTTGFLLRRGR